MKKQFKKLGLSKRTISNLKLSEMDSNIGGHLLGATQKCSYNNSKCEGCSYSCHPKLPKGGC